MVQMTAFVLRSEPFGELDRRYSLLTQELGKIKAVAKGVRQIKAKLSGHLEPVNFCWLGMIERKSPVGNGRLAWQVAQALELESFPTLRAKPELFSRALAGAQILDNFLADALPDKKIFDLWQGFIFGMERNVAQNNVEFDPEFFLSQFSIRLLSLLGLVGDPKRCSSCGKGLEAGGAYFVANHFLCRQCSSKEKNSVWLSPKTLGVLAVILGGVWLPQSSEAGGIRELAKSLGGQAKRLMI